VNPLAEGTPRPRLGGAARYALQRLVFFVLFAVVLFAVAGRLDWPQAWGYLAVTAVLEVANELVLWRLAPETLRRRGTSGSGVAGFDRVFAVLWLALLVVTAVVAGLDAGRFGWSSLPAWLFVAGAAVLCAAEAFGTWAEVVNTHFEQFVRIQADRGHRVVSTGPYRVVRHPGYLAAIVGALVTPLLLGSAWAFAPAVAVAVLFVVRTGLEDAFLRRDLPGYAEYAARTRHRLVPFVW
jgi:protein-S-isoprenylcysteine O-methyltransferase Ste14